jgi:hypothetical protein
MAEFRFQAKARLSRLINTSKLPLGTTHTPVKWVPRGVNQPQRETDHSTALVLSRPFASSCKRYLAYNLIFTPSTCQNGCLGHRGKIAIPTMSFMKWPFDIVYLHLNPLFLSSEFRSQCLLIYSHEASQ